jgi:replicative DNA helicase
MQNLGINTAMNGFKVLYFSLEDAIRYGAVRILSRYADMDNLDLRLGRVGPNDWQAITDAATRLSGLGFWMDDRPGLTAAQICQATMRHHRKHGVDLVIIDHLGEIDDDGSSETETIATTRACKAVRNLALEMDIPIILGHQLNRKNEERSDKRPQLADLRQSGSVEAIARNVWFLYRPGFYSGDDADRRLELIVAKTNHGRTGTLEFWLDLSRMFTRDWDVFNDGAFYPPKGGEMKPVRDHKPDWKGRALPTGDR